MMHRRNFGRRSGVVIDTCKDHGVWFDAHELERILRWIRDGGEARSRKRTAEEQQRKRSAVDRFINDRLERMARDGGAFSAGRDANLANDTMLDGILATLFDL